MANDPRIFDPHHADRVLELARIGMSKQDIAADLGISLRDLTLLYRGELKKGLAHGHEPVLRKLHEIAVSGENTSLLIFYVKSQCGWRDTGTSPTLARMVHRTFSVALDPGAQKDSIPDKPRSE
jgi:hypothetical protein